MGRVSVCNSLAEKGVLFHHGTLLWPNSTRKESNWNRIGNCVNDACSLTRYSDGGLSGYRAPAIRGQSGSTVLVKFRCSTCRCVWHSIGGSTKSTVHAAERWCLCEKTGALMPRPIRPPARPTSDRSSSERPPASAQPQPIGRCALVGRSVRPCFRLRRVQVL